MTHDEQKTLIDAIAAALFGWPNDGTLRTYAPQELPSVAARLRRKAQTQAELREEILAYDFERPEQEPQGAPTQAEIAARISPIDGKPIGAKRYNGSTTPVAEQAPQGAPPCAAQGCPNRAFHASGFCSLCQPAH